MEKEFSVMESPIVYEISSCVRQHIEKCLKALPDKSIQGLCAPTDVPIWYIRSKDRRVAGVVGDLLISTFGVEGTCLQLRFRGVGYSLEKLIYILAVGVDVNPTNEVIYTSDDPNKSNEYGGNPRIMMCLDINCLKNSWQSLSATATDADRREIVKDYPYTMIDDGTEYFSRLKDERRRFSPYEFGYAQWIPGDSRKALKALFILDDIDSSEMMKADLENRVVDHKKRLVELLLGKVESCGI